MVVFPYKRNDWSCQSNCREPSKAVQDILDPFGGVKYSTVFVIDHTQSSLNMRDLKVQQNSGIVSFNDQSNVSNLLLKDLFTGPYIANAI